MTWRSWRHCFGSGISDIRDRRDIRERTKLMGGWKRHVKVALRDVGAWLACQTWLPGVEYRGWQDATMVPCATPIARSSHRAAGVPWMLGMLRMLFPLQGRDAASWLSIARYQTQPGTFLGTRLFGYVNGPTRPRRHAMVGMSKSIRSPGFWMRVRTVAAPLPSGWYVVVEQCDFGIRIYA